MGMAAAPRVVGRGWWQLLHEGWGKDLGWGWQLLHQGWGKLLPEG